MKTRSGRMTAVFAAFVVLALGSTWSEVHGADWKLFSKGLNQALKSEIPGLQNSAMRMIVKYGGENLDVRCSLPVVIKLYDQSSEKETRDLALLAIFQIDKKKAAEMYLAGMEWETQAMRHVIDIQRARR